MQVASEEYTMNGKLLLFILITETTAYMFEGKFIFYSGITSEENY